MKIGEIVWFQAYKDAQPVQGRIVQIGRAIEVGFGWDETDERIFYVLETIGLKYNSIFTKTTAQWLSKTKQSWEKPEW